MYPFNFETSTEINTNTISLILTEESDVSDVHAYNLCYPDYFYGIFTVIIIELFG